MKRKKVAALCMAIGLSIVTITGCSGTGAASTSASTESSAETTEENVDASATEDTTAGDAGAEKKEGPGQDGETPPDAPDGENGDGQKPDGEKPDGEKPDGEKPDGEKPDGEKPEGGKPGEGGFGGSSEVTNGTSANTISEDTTVENESYSSTGDDENALRVDGAKATLTNITVEKTAGSSSNTEDGDWYGQNAGLLALNGATVNITGATITTGTQNGNGVFSYGEGTTVNISDSKIRTTGNNSGGIHTTGGGTMNAEDLDVETEGNSAAAIRSDRGGGDVNVTGGTYTTNGTGSPAVYCTADISVEDATLTANASEGVVVEGKNSVSLKNCTVVSSMDNTYNGDENENIHGIMIYQSMSGDAEEGSAGFSSEGGSITVKKGDLFYVTNTSCSISLTNTSLKMEDKDGVLLRVAGNDSSRGWGTEGKNGGTVTMTTQDQTMEGDIIVDEISDLDLTMNSGTKFTGTINSTGDAGEVKVTLAKGATWTLTGDSYITSFDGDLTNVTTNGYHLYVDGEKVK